MLNVLMITSRADFGGGPEHVYQLVRHLPDEIQVWVACPMDIPYWERYAQLLGLDRLIRIPHRRFTWKSFLSVRRFVIDRKIDIIHSHGKGAGLFGRLLGISLKCNCIHTFHGIHLGEYGPVKKFFYIQLERFFSSISEYLISVSPSEFSTINLLTLCRPEKLKLIENGVCLPDEIVNYDNYSQKPKIIIQITRFDYAKNTHLAIKVIQNITRSKLNEFQLHLIGDGPEREDIQNYVAEHNLSKNVIFVGCVPNPSRYLKSGFCYLSTSRWEGLPLGVLEAMATGLPTIASNVSGNKDVVQPGENGFLFDLDSPQDAASYIEQLSSDYTEWVRISENAKGLIARKYHVERMAKQVAEIYKQL